MVIMIEVRSAQQVGEKLGQMFPKGKAPGVFPAERHVVTGNESKGMTGLVSGSRQTSQQEYGERAEGKDYKGDVSENPKFYNNEQP